MESSMENCWKYLWNIYLILWRIYIVYNGAIYGELWNMYLILWRIYSVYNGAIYGKLFGRRKFWRRIEHVVFTLLHPLTGPRPCVVSRPCTCPPAASTVAHPAGTAKAKFKSPRSSMKATAPITSAEMPHTTCRTRSLSTKANGYTPVPELPVG
jgi:hypothetical protein